MKKHNILVLVTAILFVCTGCTTLPSFVEQTDPLSLFDEGAFMYAHINVEGNESLLESIISGSVPNIDKNSIETILQRSTQLYLAFYDGGTSAYPTVQLGLQGMFPTVLVNASLGSSKGWENTTSTVDGKKYTYKKHATGIELASISTSLVMVTTGDIAPIMDRHAKGIKNVQNWPEAYSGAGLLESITKIFETSSSVSLYIPKVDTLLPAILQAPIQLPVEYAFGTVTNSADNSMTLDLQLKMTSARLASGTMTMLKFATLGSDMTLELRGDDVIFINNIPFTSFVY